MISKITERDRAIHLRKQGKTYSEILSVVPVAKSTLSLWLRSVNLAQSQQQRITAKRRASQLKGGEVRHLQRVRATEVEYEEAAKELEALTRRELFLIGIALYWAEGSKEKKGGKASMVDFANSDPAMVRLFVDWLLSQVSVQKNEIAVRLHLRASYMHREHEIQKFWSSAIGIPLVQFGKTNIKKHNPKTKRKNIGQEYRGLVSVRVRKSTKLNRRIQGLIYAIIAAHKNCQIV